MKKSVIFIFAFFIILNAYAQYGTGKGFRLYGTIKGLQNSWVKIKLNNTGSSPVVVDSVQSKDGVFLLQGKVGIPEIAFLTFENQNKKLTFFIENSDIQLLGNIDSIQSIQVNGSRIQYEYEKVMREMKVFTDLQKECNSKYSEAQKKNDNAAMELYDSISTSVFQKQIDFMSNYALKYNNSVVAPYIVMTQLIYYIELEKLDSITSGFDKSIAADYYVKTLKNRVEVLKKVAIGQPAIEIVQADTNGVDFALSSLNGKYVLIDFWASWCGPCRKENPNVVEVYNLYKNKGFDILGVSMDQDKKNWLKAIVNDKLTWHHVSDLKGWYNEAGKLYGVNSIPHSVLIDRNGIIIAKNLRGDDLKKKLAELLGK